MIVLDASVVAELLLRTANASLIEERVLGNGDALHAPHLIDAEVTQVLRRYSLRGEMTASRAAQGLSVLGALPLIRHSHVELLDRVWELRANLTAYDALYVALAEALDAPLVTRDAKLAGAPGHQAQVELI